MTGLARNAAPAAPAKGEGRHELLKAAWLGGAALSAGVALFSHRYMAGVGPGPPTVAHNGFLNPWTVVRAASAATALLLGPVQFLPAVRRRWPRSVAGRDEPTSLAAWLAESGSGPANPRR